MALLSNQILKTYTLGLHQSFVECYLQSYSELYGLQDAIVDAKRDLIHPTILTPSILRKQMQEHLLPQDQQYPLSITIKNIARYFDICEVHTQLLKNHLIFVIEIPLISTTQF